ncbi:MAG: sel1 repeat family protein [Nitrosomonadales bacterium]|nr:sel1 repeat family protein [Nitrosomonadales bacterium]
MYYFGEGVPKDAVKATGLWQKAAAHANTDAQYNLALAYYLGDGVRKGRVIVLCGLIWRSNMAVT